MAIRFNYADFSNPAFLNSLQTMQPYSILQDENSKLYYVTGTHGVSTISSPDQYQQLKSQFQFPAEGSFAGAPAGYGTQTTANSGPKSTVSILYQKYFGRDATPAEEAEWAGKSGLDSFLMSEQQKYGVGMGGTNTPPGGSTNTSSTTGGGPDMTGWSESMIASYQAMASYLEKLAGQGKTVNPNITIDEATIQKFTAQAKTELGPYYKSMFDQAQSDLQRSIDRIKQDYSSTEKDIGDQYGQALESTQEAFARRGLNFSTERDKAEKLLADRASRTLQQNLQNAQRSAEDVGFAQLKQYGSSNLPGSYDIGTGATPMTRRPGQYGIEGSNTVRSNLFTPPSNLIGTQERQKLFDEKNRVNELTANERQLRGFYTM